MRTLALFLAMAAAAQAQAARVDKDCVFCHEDQAAEWKNSVHAKADTGCTSCHGTDELAGGEHTFQPTFRPSRLAQIARDCGSCHEGALKEYQHSEHSAALIRGADDAKQRSTCTACHGYHDTAKTDRAAILKRCLECHGTGSQDYKGAVAWKERADSLEETLGELEAGLIRWESRAGVRTRDLGEQLREARGALAESRTRQHGLEFSKLGDGLARSHEAVSESLVTLKLRATGFGASRLSVVVFLVGVLVTLSLVAYRLRSGGKS